MSRNGKVRKSKCLRVENLEARHLLSGVPLGGGVAEAVEYVAILPTNEDIVYESVVADSSAAQAEAYAGPGSVRVEGTEISLTFEVVKDVTNYTAVLEYQVGRNDSGPVLEYKFCNFAVNAEDVAEGKYTWSFTGEEREFFDGNTTDIYTDYSVGIYPGRHTQIIRNSLNYAMCVSAVDIAPAPKVSAAGEAATENSIMLVSQDVLGWNLPALEIQARFNDAQNSSLYHLALNEDGGCATDDSGNFILQNEDGTETYEVNFVSLPGGASAIVISGLNANTSHSLKIRYNFETTDTLGASIQSRSSWSGNVAARTTREQVTAPENVRLQRVPGKETSALEVTWDGQEGTTYTIAYYKWSTSSGVSEVGAKRIVTRTAKVDGETGRYTINRLAADTGYLVSVIANENRTFSASAAVTSNGIKTYAVLPRPVIRKAALTVGTADTSVEVQITNWSKMEKLLWQHAGKISVTCGSRVVEFVYSKSLGELYDPAAWISDDGTFTVAANGKTANIRLNGLTAKTAYAISVAVSGNEATGTASRNLKVKTAIGAYSQVQNVQVTDNTSARSLAISWEKASVDANGKQVDAALYTVTCISKAGMKTVKTVRGLSATFTNLSPYMEYIITVAARGNTSGSNGLPSEPLSVQTLREIPTPVLRNISVTDTTAEIQFANWESIWKLRLLKDCVISVSVGQQVVEITYDTLSETWKTDGGVSLPINAKTANLVLENLDSGTTYTITASIRGLNSVPTTSRELILTTTK